MRFYVYVHVHVYVFNRELMHGVSNGRSVERCTWKGARLTCHVWSLPLDLCSTFGGNVKRHFVVTSSGKISVGSGTLQRFAHFGKYSQKT